MKLTAQGIKRFFLMLFGVGLIGLGVALMRLSGFGTDPFSCMNIGISEHLPITYGTVNMLMNIFLFVPVIILYPKSFGLGAFVNMMGLGYIVDFFTGAFRLAGVSTESVEAIFVARLLLIPMGILIMCLGVAIYMDCEMGTAPYDILSQIVEDRTHGKLQFKWVRVMQDLFCMLVGFLTGGTFGVVTVVVAFFTGPVVSFFRERVSKRLIGTSKMVEE